MDRETKQEFSSILSPNSANIKEDSPRKNNDRLKRDEWSEGAVSSLLEAYEAKWILRNRAKLKGQDWEDVAKHVSARANSTKSPKTQTQCKNKIESMKKRYRSESATADPSSWPLYPRLDLLLRGNAPPPPPPQQLPPPAPLPPSPPPSQPPQTAISPPIMLLEPSRPSPPPPPPVLHPGNIVQNSHDSNGFDRLAKEDGDGVRLTDHASDKNIAETDSSTPALYTDKEKTNSKNLKTKNERKKKRRREVLEISDSIRWLAEVLVRSEQARMDTLKEVEKMRAEAEAKRGEMELKRTEIIANTQLEIAKLFVGNGKGVDSSLKIGKG